MTQMPRALPVTVALSAIYHFFFFLRSEDLLTVPSPSAGSEDGS